MRALCATIALLGLCACGADERPHSRTTVVELFDGKTLDGWRTLPFEVGGGAEASVGEDGTLQLGAGEPLAGIVFENTNIALPRGDYEIELEAMIVDGNDFFCGLTFPIPSQGTCCTLIVGGWGGTLVGISNVNGSDASLNTTRHDRPFEPHRWYKIRTRVTADYLDVWIDGVPVIELDIRDRMISMRPGEIEKCQPIGLASYRTAAAYRNIKLRKLPTSPK